jgi:hypothetical protein
MEEFNNDPFGFFEALKNAAQNQPNALMSEHIEHVTNLGIEIDDKGRPVKVHASWGTFIKHCPDRKGKSKVAQEGYIEFLPDVENGIGCAFTGETLPYLLAEFELATTLLNWSAVGGNN